MMNAFLFVLLEMAVFIMGVPIPTSLGGGRIDVSRRAVCVVQSIDCNVTGTINIIQEYPTEPVIISGNIEVFTEIHNPVGEHGFHIHEFGVPHGNCTASGGHYNPHGKDHGAPTDENRHVGDLGNIMITKVNDTDSLYHSSVQITDSQISLFGNYSVAGRAIVLHQFEDDFGKGEGDGSLIHGNAGPRIACCTLNMAKPEKFTFNMPELQIATNRPSSSVTPAVLTELCEALTETIGKPELYGIVRVIPDQLMMFGGSSDPCGIATLTSIGKLGVEENKVHAKHIYGVVEQHLGIPSDRMYITFNDKPSFEVGFKGTTFHDILG